MDCISHTIRLCRKFAPLTYAYAILIEQEREGDACQGQERRDGRSPVYTKLVVQVLDIPH